VLAQVGQALPPVNPRFTGGQQQQLAGESAFPTMRGAQAVCGQPLNQRPQQTLDFRFYASEA
jgi:hypothetical protein